MTYLLKFCFLSSPFFITLSLAFLQDELLLSLKTYNLARIFTVLGCVFTRPIAENSF